MSIRKLERPEWLGYFNIMSEALTGMRAEIEVASLNLGAQLAAEWVALLGISYDPKDDVLDIALDGLDHRISQPREIYVDEGLPGLISFEAVDAGGVRHIVKLREPLMLPAPSQGR